MKTKVGLLIDLNAFPTFPKEDDYVNDENSPLEDGCSTTSTSDLFSEHSRVKAKVKQLEEFILEQLTRDGTVCGKFSCVDFQFTYRYFNSSNYSHPTKELRTFLPLDEPSFDAFEKSLESEVRNIYMTENGDLCSEANRMTLMSSAFKAMVSDFEWDMASRHVEPLPRITSSSSVKSSDSLSPLLDSVDESTRNIIYVFFRVPRDIQEMEHFVEDVPEKLDICTSSKQFLNSLVSKAFIEMITRTYQMRVNFVDMWTLHDTEEARSTNYPNSILKVLRHFHGGQVVPATSNMTMLPGLPSWKTFLKNNLKTNCIKIPTSVTRSVDGEITHVSDSSRCSTPVHNNTTSKLQAPGSERKSEVMKNSLDVNRLRKDVLLKSQSQSSLPVTNETGKTRQNSGRSHQRFSTGNCSQQILVRKPGIGLPMSREALHLLRHKSSDGIYSQSTSSCPNPKKVRRNLFTARSQEPSEEIKRLLASTAKFNFGRSPGRSRSGSLPRSLFVSPKSTVNSLHQPEFKSPGSSSVLKSRRQLDMGLGSSRSSTSLSLSPLSLTLGSGFGTGSPVQVLSGLICPESPATPPTKRIRTSSVNLPSSEKLEVIQASPEAHCSENLFTKSHFPRHGSFTFYSSSSSDSITTKSRAWEQSGKKMQAARIKDSVDLSNISNSSLSLDDLELLDPTGSPLTEQNSGLEMSLPPC